MHPINLLFSVGVVGIVVLTFLGFYFTVLQEKEVVDTQISPGQQEEIGQSITEAACLRSGNKWEKGGLLGQYHCVQYYGDANQPCTSSDECEGSCQITAPSEKGGRCARSSSPFGCFATIEDFRRNGLITCTD